ncbi:MAG: aspartate carbamoyltransferase [Zetaproteobacteria bacterium]|nr:aspartate carbamoyltransferase [Zetaproteobacteria bacterium]
MGEVWTHPRHILSSSQFERPWLEYVFKLTNEIRKYNRTKEGLLYLAALLPHRRIMLYFTQPSTRTFLSFHSACQILGAKVSEVRDASVSSEKKGESIEDSLRTFSSYVDLIIMRSPVAGLCDRIAAMLDQTPRSIPIINAGSGPDEHPTQALLDLYTLSRSFLEQGGIDDKHICFVGDLKRGRTVRSLALMLTQFQRIKMTFVSPERFAISGDLRAKMMACPNVEIYETCELKDILPHADAIYMTRLQDEYDVGEESKAVDYSKYSLKYRDLSCLQQDCVILHPMPRRDELDPAIDFDPRARYWRQERNGMWIRVALLTILLGVDHHILMPEL